MPTPLTDAQLDVLFAPRSRSSLPPECSFLRQ
jgi:hypothetical protein